MRGLRLVLLFALAATACGAWNMRPECKAAYDNCVDGCAGQCERPAGGMSGSAQTNGPDISDTWTQGCAACEYGCRDTRDRCNKP